MNKTHANKSVNHQNFEKSGSLIRWSDKQIHDILKNSLYCGKRRYKTEIFKVPAIISEATFEICKSIMVNKTHRNYLTTYTYLLKDKIVCGVCGRNYFAKYKPVQNGDKVYICSSRLLKSGNCGNAGCNISMIETAIYDQLLKSDEILQYLNSTDTVKQQLGLLLTQLKNKLKVEDNLYKLKVLELNRLEDLYLEGGIGNDRYYSKRSELLSVQEALESAVNLTSQNVVENEFILKRVDNKTATKKMLSDARNNRKEMLTIFNQLINNVIINKLDNNRILATVFLTLNGIPFPHKMKLILDMAGIRKKPIQINYMAIFKMENEPLFEKSKLLNDLSDIVHEVDRSYNERISVDPKNVLFVEPPAPLKQLDAV